MLRKKKKNDRPVIAMTALALKEDIDDLKKQDFQAIITNTIDIQSGASNRKRAMSIELSTNEANYYSSVQPSVMILFSESFMIIQSFSQSHEIRPISPFVSNVISDSKIISSISGLLSFSKVPA